MESQDSKQQIENLKNGNKILTVEISQLYTGNQTVKEQKTIEGNFEEIEKNNQIISELEKQN